MLTANEYRTMRVAVRGQPTMPKIEKTPPLTQQEVRQARLAAELRANLKKRKALVREKAPGPEDQS